MRWEQMQATQQAEAQHWQHMREAGLKGKQNKSSEHYNIISLEYHPTREGETLRCKVGPAEGEPTCHCCFRVLLADSAVESLTLQKFCTVACVEGQDLMLPLPGL
jgi:hypothetical protein